MNVRDLYRRTVITVQSTDELMTAAQLMRQHHVGFLVVLDPPGPAGAQRVAGVITDRDLVVSVLARGADPRALRVEDVMTRDPVTVRERDSLTFALGQMRRLGVRRLPVLSDSGALAGIIALDDVVGQLARQLDDVAGSIRAGGLVEREVRT